MREAIAQPAGASGGGGGTRRRRGVLRSWIGWARLVLLRIDRAWVAANRFDIAAVLTLIMLMLIMAQRGDTRGPVAVIVASCAGLALPRVRRSAAFWLAVAAIMAWIEMRPALDRWVYNHSFLIVYWCLAMGVTWLADRPGTALAINGRLIIGLCFAFATLWKVISPQFPDGTFFHFMLICDDRFAGMAEVVLGLPAGTTAVNDHAVRAMAEVGAAATAVTLTDTPRTAMLAQAMALWTIALEGLIGAAFLCPRRWRLAKARHPALLAFMVTTYPIATVTGFARLLAVMGMTACRGRGSWARPIYLAAFLAVPLCSLPWVKLFRMVM